MLLQVLDDGRLTDSNGRTVDFRNTVIVMTSNVGARELQDQRFVGFGGPAAEAENVRSTMMKELKNTFRPEFINRVDDIIVFHKLEKEHLKEIVSLMINQLRDRLTEQDIHIEVTDTATERIAEEGYDRNTGHVRLPEVFKNVEDTLSESLLAGESFEKNKLVSGL